MTEDRFEKELELLGVLLSETQKNQLETYYKLLVEWNEKMNLTGITEKGQVYLKHFYDSATLVKVIDLKEEKTLCDIGTGAGFPGLVLKILFPHLEVTLVDALNKRIVFLENVIETLKLENIKTVHARAEEYAREHREKFDVVTSRAVAALPMLLEYSVPLVKTGKYFIPMKGDIAQEIKASEHSIKLLNVNLECQEKFSLPLENSTRTILKFRKEKSSHVKYPRKFSEMKKNPL